MHSLNESLLNNLTNNILTEIEDQFYHENLIYTICPKIIDDPRSLDELNEYNYCILYLITNDSRYSNIERKYMIVSNMTEDMDLKKKSQEKLKAFLSKNHDYHKPKNFNQCATFVYETPAPSPLMPTEVSILNENESSGNQILVLTIIAICLICILPLCYGRQFYNYCFSKLCKQYLLRRNSETPEQHPLKEVLSETPTSNQKNDNTDKLVRKRTPPNSSDSSHE